MRKFLQKLEEHKLEESKPQVTEAQLRFKAMREQYSQLEGVRALAIFTSDNDSKVVIIEKAYSYFLELSYGYYSGEYSGRMGTSMSYSSLICGECMLVMES